MSEDLESKLICICNHPKNWHERSVGGGNRIYDICYGKFCQCVHFAQAHFKYDSKKWVMLNGLEMVKNKKEKINLRELK